MSAQHSEIVELLNQFTEDCNRSSANLEAVLDAIADNGTCTGCNMPYEWHPSRDERGCWVASHTEVKL